MQQPDGTYFTVNFDYSTLETLYVRATVTAITGSVNKPNIQAQVYAEFANAYNINQSADASAIVAYIKQIAPNASVSVEGVSPDGSTWSTLLNTTGVNYQFHIPDVSHVTIS